MARIKILRGVMSQLAKQYLADHSFYRKVFRVAFPLALQQSANSLIAIVDSLMLSKVGGITAVNTATILSNMSLNITFGISCGMGVYLAQYYGSKDTAKQKQTFGLGLVLALLNSFLWFLFAALFGRSFIAFYVQDTEVITVASQYLSIAMFSYIANSLSFVFTYTYRCIQKTSVSLIISFITVISNTFFNYLLIFGNCGFPKLGIVGAGVACIISQVIGLACHFFYAYRTHQPFVGTPTQMFHWDKELIKRILSRVFPTTLNEIVFSFSDSLYIKAFGLLGALNLESYYIGNQIGNIFFFLVFAMQNTICVIMGEVLGKGDMEEAKRESKYFLALTIVLALFTLLLVSGLAKPMVSLYTDTPVTIRNTAVFVVMIFGLKYALRVVNAFFISCLRAGGDVKSLNFLDSGLMVLVGIPLSFLCVKLQISKSIAIVFFIIQIEQVIRMVLLIKRYQKGYWIRNLTE